MQVQLFKTNIRGYNKNCLRPSQVLRTWCVLLYCILNGGMASDTFSKEQLSARCGKIAAPAG